MTACMPTTYYTDDITGNPAATIWRTALRTSPLMCVPVFLFLMFRKIVGWRYPAKYGVPRPQQLGQCNGADIPREVHIAYARYIEPVLEAKFRFLFFMRANYIGSREGFTAIYLHESGIIWITLVWLHMWSHTHDRKQVIFACHSKRPTGVRLHTGPIANEHRVLHIIPPTDEMLFLPLHTPTEEVIAEHQHRIAAEKDLLRFDAETLERAIVHAAQEIFDYQLSIGLFKELTPAEVNRLIPDTYGE
jgi:hypothetical protein